MKASPFCPTKKGTKMTPFMGDVCAYLGQLLPYEKCNEVLQKIVGVEVPISSIRRITDQSGQKAEALIKNMDWAENGEQTKEPVKSKPAETDSEYVYGGMDGSMILTREEKWKEVKLGRSFQALDIDNQNNKRAKLTDSNYVAVLGHKDDFTPRMERLLEQVVREKTKLILINDGAIWIDLFIKLKYPECISIIDYFHVCEKLANFSKSCIPKSKRQNWFKEKKEKLLKKGGEEVLAELKNTRVISKRQEEEKRKLITYFENHAHKMNYPEYDKKGYYIGSGFIESAHRTVIQDRMKRSGQRWSIEGAGHMLNLKTLDQSGMWKTLVNHLFRAA